MSTDMTNQSDMTPNDEVIEAAAERIADKVMHQLIDVRDQGEIERGFLMGFREGAAFIRSFLRIREGARLMREMCDRLDRKAADPRENENRLKPCSEDVNLCLDETGRRGC